VLPQFKVYMVNPSWTRDHEFLPAVFCCHIGSEEVISATRFGAEADGSGFKGDGREFRREICLTARPQEQQSCTASV